MKTPEHVTITRNTDDTWYLRNTLTCEIYESVSADVAAATVAADWLGIPHDEAADMLARMR